MPPLTATTQRLQRRLAAIRLLKDGHSTQADVARLLGVSREAVRRWWNAYESGGAVALKPLPGKRGPKAHLTEEQYRALIAEGARLHGGGCTLADLHRLARSLFKVEVSRSAVRRRLVELGLWP